MSTTRHQLTSHFEHDDRLDELLAARALDALSPEESSELATRARQAGEGAFEPMSDFDIVAASLELASLPSDEVTAMPAHVQERLLRSGARFAEEAAARARFGRERIAQPRLPSTQAPSTTTNGARTSRPSIEPIITSEQFTQRARKQQESRSATRVLPWLLAAASLAFAAVVWLSTNNQANLRHPLISEAGPSASEIDRALAVLPGSFTLQWGDWDNPEIPGIKGSVVWNEDRQTGVLKFDNLPSLKDGEQYQLWIIDKRGLADASGQSARISGGVFNGGVDMVSKSPLVVPIRPAIEVQNAAAFAVTIEKTGGTWVSDMKRRVVIAAKPS